VTDQQFVIALDDDTEAHGAGRGTVETQDTEWLEDKLRSDTGTACLRLMPDDSDDTEGHAPPGGPVVRVTVRDEDEDDVEGHAIAIHFPSLREADAFRKRLLVTGVLVGTVTLGAAGGVGLSALQSDADSTGVAGPAAATQVGPMDAHEAPAFQSSVEEDSTELNDLRGPTPR